MQGAERHMPFGKYIHNSNAFRAPHVSQSAFYQRLKDGQNEMLTIHKGWSIRGFCFMDPIVANIACRWRLVELITSAFNITYCA